MNNEKKSLKEILNDEDSRKEVLDNITTKVGKTVAGVALIAGAVGGAAATFCGITGMYYPKDPYAEINAMRGLITIISTYTYLFSCFGIKDLIDPEGSSPIVDADGNERGYMDIYY